MKHLLLTTIAAVLVVGCATTQSPEPPTAKAPDISIHDAIEKGNIEAVKQHLAAGADVNAKNKYGSTPLHRAIEAAHKEIAELLITNGADVNAKGEADATPLHYAATKEVAELLIEKGADVNAKDKYGRTPLLVAALNGHKEIAELLITKGADVNAKAEDGGTPLDVAIEFRHPQIADLLRKHGAKTSEELKALVPRLSFIRSPFGFTFDTIEGNTYRVESGSDLKKWNKLREIKGTGNEAKFIDMRKIYFQQHFYRVVVVD